MSAPAGYNQREGVSVSPDGAVLVTLGAAALPVANGGTGSTTARGSAASLSVPFILAKSAVAVTAPADTNENTLATITVPANAMGANGVLRIWLTITVNNNANAKTIRVRYSGAAGTQYAVWGAASGLAVSFMTWIANRNATNSQVGPYNDSSNIFTVRAQAVTTSAVDTTAATTIVITGTKATGTDTITLETYMVELLADGT